MMKLVVLSFFLFFFSFISGQCPSINPLPDVDPWSVRVVSAGFGGIRPGPSTEYKDLYLSSPSNKTSIGIRLTWGGSVVFFGLPGANVIDAHDTGRELQVALYDPDRLMQPCACNATCRDNPPPTCPNGGTISYLGWDPVQGGDKCGNGSPINSAGQVRNDTMQVIVSPVMWNPDWDQCTCVQTPCDQLQPTPSDIIITLEFRYISELVVEVMTQVQNTADLSHNPTNQEFPTIYVSNGFQGSLDLPVLLSGNGSEIFIPIISGGAGAVDFVSPTPYISFQNQEQNYGIGLLMDQGLTNFQAWAGDGISYPYFHNMRTLIEFGIPAQSTVRGLSYVGLGEFSTIQAEFEQVIASRPPFGVVDSPSPPYTSYHYFSPGENMTVAGWVLDNTVGVKVSVVIDGQLSSSFPLDVPRPDVCQLYPQYAGCPNVGYSGVVSLAGLSTSCPHLVHIVASDSHGNDSLLGDRIIAFH